MKWISLRHSIRLLMSIAACVCMFVIFMPAGTVQAKGGEGIGEIKAFEKLDGDAKYLAEKYRNNYYLDLEETGVLEMFWSVFNGIANVLFSVVKGLAYLTVAAFYFIMNFDISAMFASEINGVQQALNDSIFQPLFLLACAFCFAKLLSSFIKNNLVSGIVEIAKIVFAVVLSMLVVQKSDVILSYSTEITKTIGVDALVSINDSMGLSGNIEDFSAQAAGILWVDLVHEPWKTVEFMGVDEKNYDDSDVKKLMEIEKEDEEERNGTVAEYVDKQKGFFNKKVGLQRIGFLFVYLFPCIAKCGVFLLVSGAQLIFQLMAVFFMVLAPVMLILYLIPGYESMLEIWLKKMLETQIMILVVTLMLSLLIRVDVFTYGLIKKIGWFIVLILQIILGVGLFLSRKKIFGVFNSIQRGVSMPRYTMTRMKMAGNVGYMARDFQAGMRSVKNTWNHVNTAAEKIRSGSSGVEKSGSEAQRPVYKPERKQPTEAKAEQKQSRSASTVRQEGVQKEKVIYLKQHASSASGRNVGASSDKTAPRLAGAARQAADKTERTRERETVKPSLNNGGMATSVQASHTGRTGESDRTEKPTQVILKEGTGSPDTGAEAKPKESRQADRKEAERGRTGDKNRENKPSRVSGRGQTIDQRNYVQQRNQTERPKLKLKDK